MWVNIDMDNMCFTHAHPIDQQLLSNLSGLELSEVGALCGDGHHQATYARFTEAELKLLYKNTFGTESFFGRGATIQVLIDNVGDLPTTNANPYEVLLQLRSLSDDDATPYRYKPGSYVPQAVEEETPLPALVLKGFVVPATPPKVARATPEPANAPAAAPRAPVARTPAPQAAKAPQAGFTINLAPGQIKPSWMS